MAVRVSTIVVAGGSGTRFGAPKQFCDLGGVTVLDRSVALALAASDAVCVVLPADADWTPPPGVVVAPGGASRSESTRNGLAAIPRDTEIVVVHDAARPLCPPSLFVAVIDAVVAGVDAAIPGLAVSDTVKRVERGGGGDVVVGTVDRSDLVTVQTPQAFPAEVLRAAHAGGGVDTDDAALVEAAGGRVVVVPGDPRNLKITVADDLRIAAALLEVS